MVEKSSKPKSDQESKSESESEVESKTAFQAKRKFSAKLDAKKYSGFPTAAHGLRVYQPDP